MISVQQCQQAFFQQKNEIHQGIELYNIFQHLGSGNYGDVFLIQHIQSQKYYAIKILDYNKLLKENILKYAISERNIMQKCDSPFIVKLHHSFQSENHLIMVMDYCPGGDLYSFLQKKQRFDEELAIKYLCEVLLALEELHFQDVIYRDMKPENIVRSDDGHIKLIDFGLSKENIGQGQSKTFVGSAVYMAPEIIGKKGHNKAVDWYQFGILAYELMVGQPPFNQLNRQELYYYIQNKEVKFPSYLSENAKNLISALLHKNPEERLGKGGSQEVKQHPFFKQINWFDIKQKIFQLPKPDLPKIVNQKIDLKQKVSKLKQENQLQDWYYYNNEM
ncbi:protein kinase domain protein [Ichthyophthirius multifiliis]|uniref:Protein kinase domain protein n=1 Tax=Ichthyophthirius multifiliis TaxID=5932 RepID=G0QZI2_ICHMU|nr:protein kinase domain protein [Ichthyophthirius multifiliis]EGR29371.1 protein kinase domain protein [Ichthyophthirius multifiliis]|eukprot:XP_004030607.1 protein kinase domain protein [Ichthyophthirius multifiliis]